MGCGSSSLKGETPSADLNTPAQPVTRVKSSFADVDFGADAKRRKSTKGADRAPHEVDEPRRAEQSGAPEQSVPEQGQGEVMEGDLASEEMARTNQAEAAEEAAKLEPYKSTSGAGEGERALNAGEKVPNLVR